MKKIYTIAIAVWFMSIVIILANAAKVLVYINRDQMHEAEHCFWLIINIFSLPLIVSALILIILRRKFKVDLDSQTPES